MGHAGITSGIAAKRAVDLQSPAQNHYAEASANGLQVASINAEEAGKAGLLIRADCVHADFPIAHLQTSFGLTGGSAGGGLVAHLRSLLVHQQGASMEVDESLVDQEFVKDSDVRGNVMQRFKATVRRKPEENQKSKQKATSSCIKR
jgi:hypothetical protein